MNDQAVTWRATPSHWQAFVVLATYVAFAQLLLGFAYGSDVGGNLALALLHLYGFWWAATVWWARDRHRVGEYSGIDTGLFFGYLWPVALPYQLLRYHGLRGVACVALLVATYLVPYYTGFYLAVLLHGKYPFGYS